VKALRKAYTTPEPGLKFIVAEGECQLERQRRPCAHRFAARLKAGKRVWHAASAWTRTCLVG